MKKRLLTLIIGLAMVISLAACQKNEATPTPESTPTPTVAPTPTPEPDPTEEPAAPETTPEDNDTAGEENNEESSENNEENGEESSEENNGEEEDNTPDVAEDGLIGINGVLFQEPVMLTSVGQSADVSIVETLFKRAGVDVDMSATLAADALRTSTKTLVLAVGGSSKGLGAAGIDENEELARVQALLARAEELGVQILTMHIGGSARRGALSDMFIPVAIEVADAAIILSEGDTDNLMRNMLIEGEIPSVYIETAVDAVDLIKQLFGQ